ncbi:putative proteasome inhibitor [Tetrabaena socialis]|uniref:Putative proteasome inhibitor n=1 Tax=Tetrabaena socialis TaxID=47790 RepID=A0A2J8AEZ2_9CHLO|nr:putative proteasome inhibitor [Tetrabaena socialis]|eukprot:PNH11084.1 putative proteasome inhibitor [Tetrabaena socialis]
MQLGRYVPPAAAGAATAAVPAQLEELIKRVQEALEEALQHDQQGGAKATAGAAATATTTAAAASGSGRAAPVQPGQQEPQGRGQGRRNEEGERPDPLLDERYHPGGRLGPMRGPPGWGSGGVGEDDLMPGRRRQCSVRPRIRQPGRCPTVQAQRRDWAGPALMATPQALSAVIRAARPEFRSAADRVVFAVHAVLSVNGFSLRKVGEGVDEAVSRAASALPAEEADLAGWNAQQEMYSFLYVPEEQQQQQPPLQQQQQQQVGRAGSACCAAGGVHAGVGS